MKKLLSSLLTAMMLVGTMLPMTVAPVSAADAWTEVSDIATADFVVALIGDSHMNNNTNSQQWFDAAIEAQKAVSGGNIDALAMTGDVIYYVDSLTEGEHYHRLVDKLNTAGFVHHSSAEDADIPYVYGMGNHEFPQNDRSAAVVADSIAKFEAESGQPTKNYAADMGGYRFVTCSPESYNNNFSAETETWAKAQIDEAIAADPNKPVFLIMHSPTDEFFGTSYKSQSADFVEYLRTKPQVVMLSAHMHIAAHLPQTIMQNGYTQFQTPMTGGGYIYEWQAATTGNYSDHAISTMTISKENVVKIYKFDVDSKEMIGEPWVLDIPAMVADETKEGDAWLYSANKRTDDLKAKPYWPEDAAISVQCAGNAVSITYPNTAICEDDSYQQETFVRGYKVEILNEAGKPLTAQTYQADFYKPEAKAASFTRMVGGLPYEKELTASVTPIGPLGGLGTPLTATFTTGKDTISENAIRCEFEDYVPASLNSIVKSTTFASGGKLYMSANGGSVVANPTPLNRNTDATLTFDVDLPADGKYNIDYVLGDNKGNAYVGVLTVKIDGVEIGKNSGTYKEDLSNGNVYPWEYIPMRRYQKAGVELTKGTHTVTLEVAAPTATVQPHIFAADYIQFEPLTAIVSDYGGASVEFENYVDDFYFAGAKATAVGLAAYTAMNCSNGSYVHVDAASKYAETDEMTLTFDVEVLNTANYNFELVASDTNKAELYLDDAETPFLGTTGSDTTTTTRLDPAERVDDKWPHFDNKWHPAFSYKASCELTEGAHTITMKVPARFADGGYDVALALDNLRITPANPPISIAPEGDKLEMELYQDQMPNSMVHTEVNSGATILYHNYDQTGTSTSETIVIPVVFEATDYYNLEYLFGTAVGNSTNLSKVEIAIDGTVVANNLDTFSTSENVAGEAETGDYIKWRSALMTKFSKTGLQIAKGPHEIAITVHRSQVGKSGPTVNDTKIGIYNYQMDYISFTPDRAATTEISATVATRMEMEDYAPYFRAEMSDGSTYIAKSEKSDGCSNGNYLFIDSKDGLAVNTYETLTIPVHVTEAGEYNVEYVVCSGVSPMELYLDGERMDAGFTKTNGGAKNDAGKYAYFSSSWAQDVKYNGTVTLSEGDHEITMQLKNRGGSLLDFAIYFDYLELSPVTPAVPENSCVIENGVATATAYFDKAVSGKAVLALYNGGTLVALGAEDVTDVTSATVKVPVTETVTKAKLFVVDGLANFIPQIAPAEYILN